MPYRLLLAIAGALLLNACALFDTSSDPTKDWSASQLYAEAREALNDGNYETAIKHYETLEARYPFGPYAEQAQLEVAYAYYKYEEFDSAIAAADRFIRLLPRHRNVDYAHYLKGLANFNRGQGFIDRIFSTDYSERDPVSMRAAFFDFAELLRRFPDSRYAEDARQRMVFLRNSLARHELHVADFYMRRQAYVAAINRARTTLQQYPGAPATPVALALMVEAYEKLELPELAADAGRVLALNYPDQPRGARARREYLEEF